MRGGPETKEPEMGAVTTADVGEAPQPEAAALRPAPRSDDDGKWPLAIRVAFITGSAAVLWGLVWLGYRAL